MSDLPCRVIGDRDVDVLLAAGRVVGYRHDGLGCRLVALLNTLRLSRLLGLEAEFLWETGPAGDGRLHGYSGGNATAFDEPILTDIRSATLDDVPGTVNMRANKPLRLRAEAPEQVHAELRVIARDLRLAGGMRLGETITPGRFAAGLHVRAGDTRQIRWLLTKYFPEVGWMQVLDQVLAQDGTGQVFIASDSAQFSAAAKRRHGGRVVTPADLGPTPADKLAADLREVTLLAQSARVVAPRMSNFSQLASLIGAVPRLRPEDVLQVAAVVDDLSATAAQSYATDVRALVDALDAVDRVGVAPVVPEMAEIRRTLAALEKRLEGVPRFADVTSPRSGIAT